MRPEETIESHRKLIADLARNSLSEHEITQKSESDLVKAYICRGPKNSFHWFGVIFAPRLVVVYGDIGDLTLNVNQQDTRAWALCSDEMDYVLGKAVRPELEFFPEEARRAIKASFDDESRYAVKLQEQFDLVQYDLDNHEWHRMFYEVTGDGDAPGCTDFSSEMLWCYHALRKFVEMFNRDLPTVV